MGALLSRVRADWRVILLVVALMAVSAGLVALLVEPGWYQHTLDVVF